MVLAGRNRIGRRIRKIFETIVINAHGGLLYSSETLEMNALVVLTNPATEEEQECRVVYVGDETLKGQRIGLEFVTPSPHFWGVDFTQPDWVAAPSQPASTANLTK